MNKLVKRDRAILEYLVYHYGREKVAKILQQLNEDNKNSNKK